MAEQPEPEPGEAGKATFELEHAIGYSGEVSSSLVAHPNGQDLIYAAGGCVVACDKDDPHKQTFFRGHDAAITCLAVSTSGRLIASGQSGTDSDVIVWDFENKSVLFRCQEHDNGVAAVAFTEDEKLLATLGIGDKTLVVWEVASGRIVGSVPVGAVPMTCVAWGGAAKDIKRRPTSDYILATAGADGTAILWLLNPYTSTLTGKKFNTGARPCIRNYTCAQFSADGDWLFCGSGTGDFTTFSVRSVGLKALTAACGGGVLCISVAGNDSILVGGGDGSLTEFSTRDEEKVRRAASSLSAVWWSGAAAVFTSPPRASR
jgi:WD40 repeat protein